MSTSSARNFRVSAAFKRATITRGYLSLAFLPEERLAPATPITGPIPIALPLYPNVLARTAERALCFAHEVPVIYLRGPSLLGR